MSNTHNDIKFGKDIKTIIVVDTPLHSYRKSNILPTWFRKQTFLRLDIVFVFILWRGGKVKNNFSQWFHLLVWHYFKCKGFVKFSLNHFLIIFYLKFNFYFNPISVVFLLLSPKMLTKWCEAPWLFHFSNYTPDKSWMAVISHIPASESQFEKGNCTFLISEIINFPE